VAIFAVSPAAGGSAGEEGAADCEGCGTPGAVGGTGGAGGVGTIGSATSPWGPLGGTGSGIAAETGGTTGVCGTLTAGVAVCDGDWIAAATIAAVSGSDGCGSAPQAGATATVKVAATTLHNVRPTRRESQVTSPLMHVPRCSAHHPKNIWINRFHFWVSALSITMCSSRRPWPMRNATG
jgi:hypothetical protein